METTRSNPPMPAKPASPAPRPGHHALKAAAAAALLLAAGLANAATGDPARASNGRTLTPVFTTAPCGRVEIAPVVQVSVGKSTVIRPASPISRVLLGNPEGSRAAKPVTVKAKDEKKDETAALPPMDDRSRPGVAEVDVVLLGPNEIYLLGKSLGSTNVVLLDNSGRCTAFDVVVGMDTAALQTVIGQLLPEEQNVRVSAAFDSVVLTGTVTDSGAVARVMDLANAYVRGNGGGNAASVAGVNPRIVNMMATGAPQQVMLEVKVAEVSKSLLDAFGINFSRAYIAGDGSVARFLSGILGGATGTIGQISGIGPKGVPFSSVDAVVGGVLPGNLGNSFGNVTRTFDSAGRPIYTTTYGTLPGRGVTNATLDMQKTDGLVKVLAEPNVMAISGQEGRFNAGGKIFIPVAQQTQLGGTTVTLEEKQFGVSIQFKPTVLDGSRINLQMVTEVSDLNRDGVAIASSFGTSVLPSFTSRSAATTVQLQDGQSFAVGGLIKNNTTTNVKAFPVLGELPILGALFRSTEFQSDKSELVFVITPRLVKPLPPNYALPTDNYVEPTRKDLILDGRLEGRKGDAPPPGGDAKADAAAAQPAPLAQPAADAAAGTNGNGFQVK